eukprot:CAMPEP_0204112756 /NCGR_PEP_ID=MMETSP0361-20130328/3252_1 /ASSEMBLY_ACC=CAM_ASM_000343 /TAXON_ID=268821 /ORGANISM="Scrippsiella Hangoei, Strain SHTV-5" /LENGTH=86 /DNA_ID=CAMNT_0051063015 /DNA_START=8 /DNA_END=265 /DNA_ORIENTATION=+
MALLRPPATHQAAAAAMAAYSATNPPTFASPFPGRPDTGAEAAPGDRAAGAGGLHRGRLPDGEMFLGGGGSFSTGGPGKGMHTRLY